MAGLKTKDEYGALATATSLGIAVLKKAKKNTWAELTEAMSTDDPALVKAFQALDLTPEQLGMIAEHQDVLDLLMIAPPVIPAVCPTCGHFVLTNDTAPSKCQVTASCTGKPVKVAAATTAKPSDDETDRSTTAKARPSRHSQEVVTLKPRVSTACWNPAVVTGWK